MYGGKAILISFESTQLFYFVFPYFPCFQQECEAIRSVLFFQYFISFSFISDIILYLFPVKAFKIQIVKPCLLLFKYYTHQHLQVFYKKI